MLEGPVADCNEGRTYMKEAGSSTERQYSVVVGSECGREMPR